MRKATASVSLACSPEAFWRIYLDPAYVKALYLDELRYKACEVLEISETARKLRVVPRLNLPGPIEALIGDGFAYEDHGTLDRATATWTWQMVQPRELAPGAKARKDVVRTSGTLRVVATPDGCRRTDDLTIEAKVFGIGGLIEGSAEKEARAAWDKEFVLLQRWVAKQV